MATAAIRQVPTQYATIQAAIDAAASTDTVLVAQGVYTENLMFNGKSITLASLFLYTKNPFHRDQTIIDGGGGIRVIRINPATGPPATIVGLTLRHADDGVGAVGMFNLWDCRVTGTGDGIDYESGGGGTVRRCVFENNSDDGIDLDNIVTAVIEDNTIRNNGDDGIEIRLQEYSGPTLVVVIRNNTITGNREDGIQFIGYSGTTSRRFRVEKNLIANNAKAGVGTMCCENSVENYQGANIGERVELYNNTIVANNHGVTAGDSLIAVNNIIVQSSAIGLKGADAGSIVIDNLFWDNYTNYTTSNINPSTNHFVNPLFTSNYHLQPTSPAIDTGTPTYLTQGQVIWVSEDWVGSAPDLGAYETAESVSVPAPAPPRALMFAPVPNPGSGSTALRVDIVVEGRIRLEIVDVAGRRVRLLVDEVVAAGRKDVLWDGRDDAGRVVPSGVYSVRLENEGRLDSRRFVRLR